MSDRPPPSAFHTALRGVVHSRALMSYPGTLDDEAQGIAYLSRLLPQMTAPARLRHPLVDLEMELPASLGPRLFYLISMGEYELGDLELLHKHARRGDRIMEIGGGVGLTPAMSAKLSGNEVIVVEPDERLFPLIRRQVELNGGSVSFEHGAVGAGEGESVEFFLDEEVWFSSMRPVVEAHGERRRQPIRVPRLKLAELLSRHRPTLAMIDIEGAELGLFEGAYPYLPARLLIEIHFPILGEEGGARAVQSLIDLGYRWIDCRGWTFVFERA